MSIIGSVVGFVRRRAENLVALLFGLMFAAFIVQIFVRKSIEYLPASAESVRKTIGVTLGYTAEFSVIAWLYIVLVGSALWLKESDEIRIDLVSNLFGPAGRRVIAALTALAILTLYIMSYPAVLKYVTFMWREKTDYMKIRFDWLYSVYLVFAAAIILRYASHLIRALQGKDAEEIDITKNTSGL